MYIFVSPAIGMKHQLPFLAFKDYFACLQQAGSFTPHKDLKKILIVVFL